VVDGEGEIMTLTIALVLGGLWLFPAAGFLLYRYVGGFDYRVKHGTILSTLLTRCSSCGVTVDERAAKPKCASCGSKQHQIFNSQDADCVKCNAPGADGVLRNLLQADLPVHVNCLRRTVARSELEYDTRASAPKRKWVGWRNTDAHAFLEEGEPDPFPDNVIGFRKD
jgi:predicted RNA-binding Zn-ribbon protein involved in translation (DUF1610 family)